MLIGLPSAARTITPPRSRRSMLETLVRHLDMIRLTVAATAILMMTGCSGLIDDGGNNGISAAEAAARQLWINKALPVLNANCTVCHNGTRANVGFIAGDSDLGMRDTILAYEPVVVNIDAPASSRLLTKGIHEGPQLDATQTSDLLEWIQAERDAALDNPEDLPPIIETAQFIPQICTSGLPDDPAAPNPLCPVNRVPLDEIGGAGAQITFVVQSLGSGLYMTNLKLVPGPMGAFIEHPLFVSYPTDNPDTPDINEGAPKADTIDRFFNVKMNLMAGAEVADQLIAGGTAAFVGFSATDKLSIHFKAVNVFQAEENPPPIAGCKDLTTFKAGAQSAFNTLVGDGAGGQNCAQCHAGQNNNATSAVDMTNINSADDNLLLLACNEIRTRLNFQDINQSGIVLAVAPNNNNHPVRFAAGDHTTFINRITAWFNAERDAP
jgi:hypothetical protein